MDPNKPNLLVPLANSYNERGSAGQTNSITNDLDQRKVNLMYEVAQNSLIGQKTLSLTLRPGAANVDPGVYGTTTQIAYLANFKPSMGGNISSFVVFSTLSTDQVRISDNAQTSTFLISSTGFRPVYSEKTAINTVDNLVVQTADSSSPLPLQKVYYSSTFPILTQIVSSFTTYGITGKMEFMDGWGLILDRNTNKIQNSNENTISTWPQGNFITKQITQDTGMGLAKLRDKLLAFGMETVEVFYNAGLSPAPLLPIKGMHERIGLALNIVNSQGHYYATVAGKMYFAGTYPGKATRVSLISFDGSRFEKVSPPYIDKILQQQSLRIQNVQIKGQQAIAVALSEISSTIQTWMMYFPEYNDWFEWNSQVITPTLVRDRFLGVQGQSDKLFVYSSDAEIYADHGTSFQWVTQFKLPLNGSHKKRMTMYGVEADTSRSPNNVVDVYFSDDDEKSWFQADSIDMMNELKVSHRGGSYRHRSVRLTGTTSTEVRLHQFMARIDG